MRAVDAGVDCRKCRAEHGEAELDPPCDSELLEDGTCIYGMPELTEGDRRATRVWGMIQALGWDATKDLARIDLSDGDRGDLLMKLLVVADELEAVQRARIEEQRRKGGR